MRSSLESAVLGLAGSLMSSIGNARLTILAYHRVLPEPDPFRETICDVDTFAWQMELLANHFRVLPLKSALRLMAEKSLPARAVCVTFDDGYADNVSVALPVLQQLRISATFFVATGFLDGGCMWNDSIVEALRNATGRQLALAEVGLGEYQLGDIPSRRSAILEIINKIKYLPQDERESVARSVVVQAGASVPTDLMMHSEDIRVLVDAGMDVGGHTVSHPILAELTTEQALAEMRDGKAQLEKLAGQDVTLFAYPNGKPGQDYDKRHTELLRNCGFSAAVTTSWGVAQAGCDYFQLPRFMPWDRSPRKFFLRLLRNYLRTRPTVC